MNVWNVPFSITSCRVVDFVSLKCMTLQTKTILLITHQMQRLSRTEFDRKPRYSHNSMQFWWQPYHKNRSTYRWKCAMNEKRTTPNRIESREHCNSRKCCNIGQSSPFHIHNSLNGYNMAYYKLDDVIALTIIRIGVVHVQCAWRVHLI